MVTNEQHNTYVSWAFIAHGSFQLLITLVMVFFIFLIPRTGRGAPPREFMFFMMAFIGFFQMIFIVPSFVAAYAMRNKKSWARLAAIIAGVIAALNVPFGTAACVYAMWFFFGESWKEVYGRSDTDLSEQQQLVSDMQTRWTGMRTDEKGEVTFHHVDPPDWR
jgi:hypothetical protein